MDLRAQNTNSNFPKAIMHVDGDSFFVACELTRRPHLKNRPVATGLERGIATAMNRHAKARGITRGMRLSDMRRACPEIVILPSDYRMYAQYAGRMYAIVRNYADIVEEYSIDECFADLTGLCTSLDGRPARFPGMTYEALARAIQAELHESLGISFSVGLGVNKVTAKIASTWNKPAGFTLMPREAILGYLGELPIGKVWGIGRATTIHLGNLGIRTALDLAEKDRAWVAEHCDKPLTEIYEEFHGAFVKELGLGVGRDPVSVQRTRTFHPPSGDPAFLWSQISYHTEDACMRLRSQGLVAVRASLFLKTSEFQYLRAEVELPDPTAAPEEVLRALKPVFEGVFRSGLPYRAAGVTLSGLRAEGSGTARLFAPDKKVGLARTLHAAADRLVRKFGHSSLYLGSSFSAMKGEGEFIPAERPAFELIYLGEVG